MVVASHMYSMPPYPYLATDYGNQLSLFKHHMCIGGFLIVGVAAHAAIFMVRNYDQLLNTTYYRLRWGEKVSIHYYRLRVMGGENTITG